MQSKKVLTTFICLSIAGCIPVFADTIRVVSTDEGENFYVTAPTPEKKPTQPAAAVIPETTPTVQPVQANTTVITAKQLDTNRYESVQEAIQQVNGVTVSEQVPGTTAFVRLNGDDRVVILVDG
ncbi:MAG: TonB-dependent receptor plug domain-containing protein, partial [Megasphaera sp.]|nr:TonB-dependent receptor plug domain-containing protein [Megasphaera sp.]